MEIKYKFASAEDTSAMTDLWESCFGDGREYVSAFFSSGAAERYTVALAEDRIVGMTALIPCFMGKVKNYYVYALCVSPQYRRMGIARTILDFAFSYVKENFGGGLLLHPAEPDLFGYYRAAGFEVPVFGQKVSVFAETLGDGHVLSREDYVAARKEYADQNNLISFCDEWVAFCYGESVDNGGFCLLVDGKYFFGREEEGTVHVTETSSSCSFTDVPVGLGRGIPTDKKYILTLMGE